MAKTGVATAALLLALPACHSGTKEPVSAVGPKPAAPEHAAGVATPHRDVLHIALYHRGPDGRMACRINGQSMGVVYFPRYETPRFVPTDDPKRGLADVEKVVARLCGVLDYTPDVKFFVGEDVPSECIGLVVDRCVRLGLTSFRFERRPDNPWKPGEEYIPEPPDEWR